MSEKAVNPKDRFSGEMVHMSRRERGGLVVNALDSGSRGRGFEPHSGQTMLYP